MKVEVIESGNAERPAVRCIAWLGVSSREGETKRQYGARDCTDHESERQKRAVKQDHDGDTPRHKYEQGDRELNIARNYDARVSLQKPGSERTGCDARKHGKPAISDPQRTLMQEEEEPADTCDKRPSPRD